MKAIKVISILIIILYFIFYIVLASGDAEKGKILFNDSKLGGGTTGNSCGSCHPDGKGLQRIAKKKEFNLGGKKQKSLEEAINVCIVNALKGQAIEHRSEQMKDLVAYIKSLRNNTSE